MKELIKIQENENLGQAVSARELYQFLEFGKGQYSRWYKKNIIKNEFSIEGIDYIGFDIMSNGNPTKDFALTLDFAKGLCMMARTEIGEQARRYFIQCEKVARAIASPSNLGIEFKNGQATISTRSISGTTGILHDELIRLIKTYLHEHTEVLNEKRYPRKGHLRKGKFLIENIWELYIHNNKGAPQKEYILTRDGFNYLVKWHGFLAFSGFLPHYSREFEILAHQEHIKALE